LSRLDGLKQLLPKLATEFDTLKSATLASLASKKEAVKANAVNPKTLSSKPLTLNPKPKP
jgi:hypothetical protein